MQPITKMAWLCLAWSSWTFETALGESCPCSLSFAKRIVGGEQSEYNKYPWIASLHYKGYDQAFCGASIISDRHALSAAHCIHGRIGSDLALGVGSTDLEEMVEYPLKMAIEHENYDEDSAVGDIALLVTLKDMVMADMGTPICLPDRKFVLQDEVKVLGWGWMSDEANVMAQNLREVKLGIMPNKQCTKSIEKVYPGAIESDRICTFAQHKDSCQGDSGGPLIQTDPNTSNLILVGVVSLGMDCAGPYPALNTAVSAYLDWIAEKVKATSDFKNATACYNGNELTSEVGLNKRDSRQKSRTMKSWSNVTKVRTANSKDRWVRRLMRITLNRPEVRIMNRRERLKMKSETGDERSHEVGARSTEAKDKEAAPQISRKLNNSDSNNS